jgi:uncharacterized membrane protein
MVRHGGILVVIPATLEAEIGGYSSRPALAKASKTLSQKQARHGGTGLCPNYSGGGGSISMILGPLRQNNKTLSENQLKRKRTKRTGA